MGAWIETSRKYIFVRCSLSRPAWARGLKHKKKWQSRYRWQSRPAWARGLKQKYVLRRVQN